MIRSWRGMEDAHLKIAKHFLLDICMHQSYHIQRLSYLYNVYIYVYSQILRYIRHRHIRRYNIHDRHTHIYIYTHKYIHIFYVTDRNKEGKAGGKRFNQMVAKWPNRSVFGWNTLYLASKVLGA